MNTETVLVNEIGIYDHEFDDIFPEVATCEACGEFWFLGGYRSYCTYCV